MASDTAINLHGSIECGELISEGPISFSRTLLHDKSKSEEWIDWSENTHTKF